MASATTAALATEAKSRREEDAKIRADLAAEGKARLAGDKLNADALAALAARVAALEAPPIVVPPPVIVPVPSWPTSLQAAIDAAAPGATIDVSGRPEPYFELIRITKPLTLRGAWVCGAHHADNATAIGIEVALTDHVILYNPLVEDVRYCGIMVSDSHDVILTIPTVRRVDALRRNANMNAYGIAVTDRGTRRSADVLVDRAVVEDVPDWHGLDTHGGQRIRFLDCAVGGTNRAVFITSSNLGPALDCEVSRCLLDTPTRRRDVANTPPYNQVGLTVVAGCTAFGDGNRFAGWPTGNAIDTQGGPNRFTGSVIVP